jgi:hypothetical protein
MTLKAAMRIHGTIVKPENPPALVDLKGWGISFGDQNTSNWFHIPIPTPVILDDARPQLVKVFVLYMAGSSTMITNVHVYDGPRSVAMFDGLSLNGDHHWAIDASNHWVINPPLTILYGLGLSIGVVFGLNFGGILFTTAGADFQA